MKYFIFISKDLNLMKSPAKKQILVSLAHGNGHNRAVTSRKSGEIYQMTNGKSVENVYEKNMSIAAANTSNNNEELSAEMANLEGIMKDLNAITAQQFECWMFTA